DQNIVEVRPIIIPAPAPPQPVAPPPVPSPLPIASSPGPATVPSGSGQLSADVLRKVKAATAFLRVQMSDGSGATGSGFAAEIGTERGIVLTNAHVLGMLDPESRPPRVVQVAFNSGETNEMRLSATILGVDRSSDLAVL